MRAVVVRSDSALRELAALWPVIADVGLAGPRRAVTGDGSAGDSGGCGRLRDHGERVVAKTSQDMGGVPDDAPGLR